MSILTLVFLTLLRLVPDPVFRLHPTPTFPTETRLMYGGAAVTDLNRDGFPDLILGYHGSASVDVFLNDGTASFTQVPFFIRSDNHGVSPGPGNTNDEMLFTLTLGGANGNNPAPPRLYSFKSGNITDVTKQRGTDVRGGRGRSSIFLNLGGSPLLDIVYVNAFPLDPNEKDHWAFENTGSKYRLRSLPGFDTEHGENVAVTDIDGDGIVELITFPILKIYRQTSPFSFVDITDDVVPPEVNRRGVISVAELDYDNDGDFDLFLARTNTSSLQWIQEPEFDDYLLENVGGKYVDVSRQAKIPRGLGTRGVTVADFNNDGYVDMFITRYTQSNFLLLNTRSKSFKSVPHSVTRPNTEHGDTAQAVDLNADGLVDLVVGDGDQHDKEYGGHYRVYLNRTPKDKLTRHVEVCVGRSPSGRSPMHAVVKLKVIGITMIRRVGEVGVAISRSYLDCLHFGMAVATKADLEVRWVGGEVVRKSVAAGTRVRVGDF